MISKYPADVNIYPVKTNGRYSGHYYIEYKMPAVDVHPNKQLIIFTSSASSQRLQ